jgi:hypothetical protein
MFYTTDALVSAAKRSEFFPVAQTTFDDPDDLIAYANEEMLTKLVPVIMSNREDYFLNYSLTSLGNSLNHYGIPERAIGNAFKDLLYVPTYADLSVKWRLPKLSTDTGGTYGTNGTPSGYYMQGDEVVLVPVPSGLTGSERLQFFYYMRPNELVPLSHCAKITVISTVGGTTTFTVDTDITSYLSTGDLCDFISGKSPFKPWKIDIESQSVGSGSIAFTASDLTDESGTVEPEVGDYICAAQTSPIPMLPAEFHPILSEMIAFRALKALGASNHLQTCAQNIGDMLKGVFKLIENRTESTPDVVFDPTGFVALSGFSGNLTTIR